ncbi:MAG: thioredoxin family protein [Pricia sp.]|nr:thioredoxin family protein [Pricia sp.]
MSYDDYRSMVTQLAREGNSTGPEQTEALTNYTILNDRRMKRFDKTVKIDSDTGKKIQSVNNKINWLVLTESWCGDAAPAMPVMNKIAELNDNIDFKVVLRDKNHELMQRFLTNGAMSIPKLIMIDGKTNEVLDDWGPRPTFATQKVENYKRENGKLTPEFKEELQIWYNANKGRNILEDLVTMLSENPKSGA